MKLKKLLIFPLLLTLFGTSCSTKNKIIIEQKENIDSFVYLDGNELTTLINNNQDFVLVVGENGCFTCNTIKPIIVDYIKKYEYIIYWIENNQYQNVVDKFSTSDDKKLKADIMSATIILFDEGKTKEVIEYSDNLYYSDTKLELTLENKVQGSKLYSLNYLSTYQYSKSFNMYKFDYSSTIDLDAQIEKEEKSLILYSWGPCPDCMRVKDDVLDEYMVGKDKKLYIFEVSHFRNDYANNPDLFNEFASKYQFNDYRGGKVPCIISYSSNTKTNMHVYFNDEYVKNEDGTYNIVNSYIPSLINTTYSNGNDMITKIRKIHKEELIKYLDENL